jgi:hypothetical protein
MRETTNPPLPQYVFMAWYLVKYRNNFTLASLEASTAVIFQDMLFSE